MDCREGSYQHLNEEKRASVSKAAETALGGSFGVPPDLEVTAYDMMASVRRRVRELERRGGVRKSRPVHAATLGVSATHGPRPALRNRHTNDMHAPFRQPSCLVTA